jgi:hypothetical protein
MESKPVASDCPPFMFDYEYWNRIHPMLLWCDGNSGVDGDDVDEDAVNVSNDGAQAALRGRLNSGLPCHNDANR